MINSKKILYSGGSNDECVTLDYAVKPIIKYLPKDWVVWCPFDTEDSEFVKQIMANGNKVVHSHIFEGKDFYTYEPDEHWDCIMSNTWLNDSAPKQLFKDKDLQLLMFDKRMRFMNNGEIQNKITFSSSYYCWNFLPKQIIMEELNIR